MFPFDDVIMIVAIQCLLITWLLQSPGYRFNTEMPSYQYRYNHQKFKMVLGFDIRLCDLDSVLVGTYLDAKLDIHSRYHYYSKCFIADICLCFQENLYNFVSFNILISLNVFHASNKHYISPANSLASSRRQAITRANGDPVHWRTFALPGPNQLNAFFHHDNFSCS